jgi:hypothetical protein
MPALAVFQLYCGMFSALIDTSMGDISTSSQLFITI